MRYGFWIVVAAVVLVDQWTKHLARTLLTDAVTLIPGGLWLRLVHNRGVAFGQLPNAGPLLIIAAGVAIFCILIYHQRLVKSGQTLHPLLVLGLSLPLGGAVGNVIDRVRWGQVTDFIDLGWFPVFNAADTAITLGAVSLMVYFFFVSRPEEHGRPAGTAQTAEAEN